MPIIFKLGFWISLLFTCRVSDSEISNKIIDSVEFQESRGDYFVKSNKYCTGLMQVDYRYTPVPRPLLRVPFINRIVGVRALDFHFGNKIYRKTAKFARRLYRFIPRRQHIFLLFQQVF